MCPMTLSDQREYLWKRRRSRRQRISRMIRQGCESSSRLPLLKHLLKCPAQKRGQSSRQRKRILKELEKRSSWTSVNMMQIGRLQMFHLLVYLLLLLPLARLLRLLILLQRSSSRLLIRRDQRWSRRTRSVVVTRSHLSSCQAPRGRLFYLRLRVATSRVMEPKKLLRFLPVTERAL